MMTLDALYWREPLWLILATLPVIILLLNRSLQQRQWQGFADTHLIPWLRINDQKLRRQSALISLLLGWALLCVALAGPRTINSLPPQLKPEPAVLVLIVDLSASMNAADIHPDRRGRAQQQIKTWLAHKPQALAISLVLFAGHAFTLMPATGDIAVLQHFSTNLGDIRLPTAGNDLSSALTLARQQLLETSGDRRLMILTDGDIEASERASVETLLSTDWTADAIDTLFIGFGGNMPVTIPDDRNGLIKHQGRPVLSRLQSTWLKRLTRSNAMEYQHYETVARRTLAQILQLSQPRIDPAQQQLVIWNEWFSLPLLLAILLITASVLLQDSGKSRQVGPGAMLLLLLGLQVSFDSPLYAAGSELLEKARQATQNDEFEQARALYSQLDSLQGDFGKGIACYRLQDYHCASQSFAKVAWRAQSQPLRAKAVFNLANSYFFLGDYDQAAVLYRDAELLGIDKKITSINLSYATSLQAALQRHVEDIRESFRRAKWRAAAAGELPPSLQDLLVSERNLWPPETTDSRRTLYRVPRQLLQQQLARVLGLQASSSKASERHWIRTDQVKPQSTAAMISRLFEMELGIMAPLTEPQRVQGKREW